MEIQIIEHMEDTLKVLIQCRKADDEVLRLKTHIEIGRASCRERV